MSLWKAILLGLIQGITEFLPVSSSGHLAIFQYIFKVNTDTGMLFEVMLHLGTLISVCIVFWKDIRKLFIEGIHLLGDVFANLKIKFKKRTRSLQVLFRVNFFLQSSFSIFS